MSDLPPWLRSQARSRLDCEAEDTNLWIDQLCQSLRQRKVRHSYLSRKQGSLLSNITIYENLWLPLAWRKPCSAEQLNRQLTRLMDDLAGKRAPVFERQAWLNSYPESLSPELYGWSILLRAALMRPHCLLIDPSWFFSPSPADCCGDPQVMETCFPEAAWLLLLPGEQSIADHWNWTRVSGDELRFSSRDLS
jgi:hypothetical protein